MIDREKVINGLEHCRKTSCESCPYNRSLNQICLIVEMLSDALELLKEQEAVKPVFDCEEPTLRIGQFHCGYCRQSFGISHYRYCPFCGRAVKWE